MLMPVPFRLAIPYLNIRLAVVSTLPTVLGESPPATVILGRLPLADASFDDFDIDLGRFDIAKGKFHMLYVVLPLRQGRRTIARAGVSGLLNPTGYPFIGEFPEGRNVLRRDINVVFYFGFLLRQEILGLTFGQKSLTVANALFVDEIRPPLLTHFVDCRHCLNPPFVSAWASRLRGLDRPCVESQSPGVPIARWS